MQQYAVTYNQQHRNRVSSPVMRPRSTGRGMHPVLQAQNLIGNHGVLRQYPDVIQTKRKAAAANNAGPAVAPPAVHDALRTTGRPLDAATRAFFEPRFGADFSRVRVHTDDKSARAVNALAYTVGRDIVFAQGHYQAATPSGRRLLAHELTHVIQQRGAPHRLTADRVTLDSSHSAAEREAQRNGAEVAMGGAAAASPLPVKARFPVSASIVSRADPAAVRHTINLHHSAGSGLKFWPVNVTDTRVGPVSVRGRLLGGRASGLSVIIGEKLTLRKLARQLLPLWVTATPFTPPGAAAPLPLASLNEEQLAKGLLVYNRHYLQIPAMTRWKAGLRFPLPVEIDERTGVATLNPFQILLLAGAFNAADAPFLDLRAGATAPPASNLQTDAGAFLASQTTAMSRGIHLGTRALTNAVAELPFFQEVFRQLRAGSFDVALAFMDNLVNRQIALLASQADGAAILDIIRTALAAAPASPTAKQQARLMRATLMLGMVRGVAASAQPAAVRTRPEKTVTIDTVKLDGSTHNPANAVVLANAIFSQCNVRFQHGIDRTATPGDTTTWLKGNTDLRASRRCGSATVEEKGLYRGATARFGLSARIRAFFPATFSGPSGDAYAVPRFCATGAASSIREMVIVGNSASSGELAHEIGHVLLNSGKHPKLNLMNSVNYGSSTLTSRQCRTIYRNA